MSRSPPQTQADSLQALHDIVIPGPVDWMPRTGGWLVLGLLLLAGAAWWGTRAYRRRQATRYRRVALSELSRIQDLASHPPSRVRSLRELPVLVKRTALSSFPREEVASLAGEAWLHFLDRTYEGTGFTRGPGRLMLGLDYRSEAYVAAVEEEDRAALFALVHRWISRHTTPKAGDPSLPVSAGGPPTPVSPPEPTSPTGTA